MTAPSPRTTPGQPWQGHKHGGQGGGGKGDGKGGGQGGGQGGVQGEAGRTGQGGEAPDAVVRRLTPADVIAFRVVRLEALRLQPDVYRTILSDWDRLPLAAYIDQIEKKVIFGLFTGKGLEGIMAYRRGTGGNERHRAEVHATYIRQTLRRRGAGRTMFAAVRRQARGDGVVQITLSLSAQNTAARSFWEHLGFAHYATTPRGFCVDGIYFDELHMIRRLDDDQNRNDDGDGGGDGGGDTVAPAGDAAAAAAPRRT